MTHRGTLSVAGLSFLLATLVILRPAPASAQGVGIRGGISIDPDQVYFGGHYETSPLIDRLHFRPNLEVGLGDEVTHVGLNMEFIYKFPRRSGWALYAGGGPALNIYSTNGDASTDGGLNILVGAEQTGGLFFEFKIGAVDSPDLKFAVGWTFK
jgi:hypothetical protein